MHFVVRWVTAIAAASAALVPTASWAQIPRPDSSKSAERLHWRYSLNDFVAHGDDGEGSVAAPLAGTLIPVVRSEILLSDARLQLQLGSNGDLRATLRPLSDSVEEVKALSAILRLIPITETANVYKAEGDSPIWIALELNPGETKVFPLPRTDNQASATTAGYLISVEMNGHEIFVRDAYLKTIGTTTAPLRPEVLGHAKLYPVASIARFAPAAMSSVLNYKSVTSPDGVITAKIPEACFFGWVKAKVLVSVVYSQSVSNCSWTPKIYIYDYDSATLNDPVINPNPATYSTRSGTGTFSLSNAAFYGTLCLDETGFNDAEIFVKFAVDTSFTDSCSDFKTETDQASIIEYTDDVSEPDNDQQHYEEIYWDQDYGPHICRDTDYFYWPAGNPFWSRFTVIHNADEGNLDFSVTPGLGSTVSETSSNSDPSITIENGSGGFWIEVHPKTTSDRNWYTLRKQTCPIPFGTYTRAPATADSGSTYTVEWNQDSDDYDLQEATRDDFVGATTFAVEPGESKDFAHTVSTPKTYFYRVQSKRNCGFVTTRSGWSNTAQVVVSPPSQVSISATDGNASESGDAGQFRFTRSSSSPSALTVNYSVGGTASPGSDYQQLSGSVTIDAGATSATIDVNAIDDTSVEGNETVIVTLSNGVGYVVGSPSSATVTIADNDVTPPTVTVTATDSNAAESGDSGTVTVTRSTSSSSPLTVNYSISGTATAGSDFEALSGSVTIAANQSSATILVKPMDDTFFEGDETVSLDLSDGTGYTVGTPASATIIIADDDIALPTVTITANDATASESNLDSGQFTVSRNLSAATALTVYYSVAGTAGSGSDYHALSGVVTIAANATTAQVNVVPIDDWSVEGTESVVVNLTSDSAYTVGTPATATVNIVDDDSPPSVTIFDDGNAAEPGTAGKFFVLSNISGMPITVHYSVGGSATNGTDYQLLSGTVTIPSNSNTADIVITPINDAVQEGNENVTISLSAGTGYTIGSPASATVTIVDDDDPTSTAVSIDATDPDAIESGDPGTFTVTRTGTSASALTVTYTIAGTAGNGIDYQAISATTMIPAGQMTATIGVQPINDDQVEGNESVVLTLQNDSGYTVTSPSTATVTIVDDDSLSAAVYEPTVQAPKCAQPANICDSGELLNGRANISGGAEPHEPNTIANSCDDGNGGIYHSDESLDRLRVFAVDGGNLRPGASATIEATVYAYADYASDYLDLYYASDATDVTWTHMATLQATAPGLQVLSATYTVPSGGTLQAIRGVFRFGGAPDPCGSQSGFDDHDDLVYAVTNGIATPANLSATYQSEANYILVSWSPVPGAYDYEIETFYGGAVQGVSGVRQFCGSACTSIGHFGASGSIRYRVRAADSGSMRSAWSTPDVATVMTFTDDPLQVGSTRIKAIHLTELQTAVGFMRAAAGLAPYSFSSVVQGLTRVNASHISQLRTALFEAYSALGMSFVAPAAAAINPGTSVYADQFQSLRNAVK